MNAPNRRNRLFRLSLLLLILLSVATVAGYAGGWAWWLDVFSHFRVQYAVVALLLCPLLWALRARGAALVAVALLAANLVPLAPLYLPAVQAAPESESKTRAPGLHVTMVNVYARNRQIERVLRHLRRENPDVVVLLEVTPQWERPLERLRRRYPFRWVHPGTAVTGIAVLSRLQPVETRAIDLGGVGTPSMLLTLELPLQGQGSAPRLSILGTHLAGPLGSRRADRRDRQLAALARVAREHPWPLLVVGDLNISALSPRFTRLLREGGLRHCSGSGLKPTWPTWGPPFLIQIDHCLTGAALETAEFRLGPYVGSDHYPFSVRVSPGAS